MRIDKMKTALFGNLISLYRSYGGLWAILTSGYFFLSILLTVLCWRFIRSEEWITLSLSILPALAGFSMAAFAIMFAILDSKARAALRRPHEKLNNRSPLLVLASSICHAVIIQIFSLLFALVVKAKPFESGNFSGNQISAVNFAVSGFGLLIFIYSIALVIASIFSVYKILESTSV